MELLGHHNQLVNYLYERVIALDEGDRRESNVVILRGPTGTGKTRIVRELFNRLRRERRDLYWPRFIDSDARTSDIRAGGDPMASRKLITPSVAGEGEFFWPENALPTFSWWGLNCERREVGGSYDVVTSMRPQLLAHMPAYLLAYKETTDFRRKVTDQTKKVISKVRDAPPEEKLDWALTSLEMTGIFGPFSIILAKWGFKVDQYRKNSYISRRNLVEELDLGIQVASQSETAGSELSELVKAVASPGFPAIVVIEDMHRMGSDLIRLVDELINCPTGRPVLVIGTALAEAFADGFEDDTFTNWVRAGKVANTVEICDVVELSGNDLVKLLLDYAPETDLQIARDIVRYLPTPFMLKLWLTIGSVSQAINQNNKAVSSSLRDELAKNGTLRHKDLTWLLNYRWNELPNTVRKTLMVAASANPLNDPLGYFPYEPIVQIIEDLGSMINLSRDEAQTALAQAVNPALWCRRNSEVQYFTEAMYTNLARKHAEDEFYEIDKIPEHAANLLRQWIDENKNGFVLPDTEEATLACQWLVNMSETRRMASISVDAIALWNVAVNDAKNYHYQLAIKKVRRALTLVPDNSSELALTMRQSLAEWLGESGHLFEAILEFETLIDDQVPALGSDHLDALKSRNKLATFLGIAGRVQEAISELESLLKDQTRVLGANHPDTLATRTILASILGKAGRVQEAILQLETLVKIAIQVLGVDNINTFVVRNNFGLALGEAGRVQEAISELESLLKDQTRVLGANHPNTLTTRSNLASLRGQAGRVQEAISELESLLKDQTRVLGANHPNTLTTRSHLASFLGEAGRVQEAISEFESLIGDQTRVLGADSPDTLRARHNLAIYIGKAGRIDEAIILLEALLVDQTRVYDIEYPKTFATRCNLADLVGQAGRIDEAIILLEALLVEQNRVLSHDHPNTFYTREILAS
ncbi:tetratricopeptide repeat protein, partial [Corynebacterium callunae]|uniref:tetratricopeptide repeat protein n=1 Tax=Corynebacterium callunae TaxID=1721 RepID=UPI0039820930